MTSTALRQRTWWHVYPLGFAGCPIRERHPDDGGRGLARLTAWLAYAADLGVDGLLLGPVFESATHGYDTLDHLTVDRRLGTRQELAELLEQAHEQGLSIVLDGVFNHVARSHPLVQRALREGPDSAAAQFFRIDWSQQPPRPEVFEGHQDLVVLDLTRRPAQDLVVQVMCHWLDAGIAGWRLDAAYAVAPWAWRAILERVRAQHPDAVFIGEVLHGDYAEFVRESGVDTLTQYELWKAIWSSLRDRNLFELDWALRRHAQFLADFVPFTFVGNHDVTRIASQVGADGALVALAILMTVGGTPAVYAGDERGWLADKQTRLGGDDAIRPEFPTLPQLLEELDPSGAAMMAAHRQVVALRREHSWLTRAEIDVVELANQRMSYRSSDPLDPQHWLLVEIDLHERARVRISSAAGVAFEN